MGIYVSSPGMGRIGERGPWFWTDTAPRSLNEHRPVPGVLASYKGRVPTGSVQSLSPVRLFVTPWTAAHQASLSITNSRNLHKLMSIVLVMSSNHLILCHPLLLLPSIFPSIGVFSNESQFYASGSQSIVASGSASVLPMNIQDWFPLGWTGLISLQSKGLSNTTVQKHQFFGARLSL